MENSKVSWKIFIWTISIILILFSISFGMIASAQNKVENSYENLYQLRTDIEVIKTDVNWIKNKLD